MLIKIIKKDEDGFIIGFRDVTGEYTLKEIEVDSGLLDDEGKPIMQQDVEKVFFEEDSIEYFTVPEEYESLFKSHPEYFKVYRKKIKFYEPEHFNVPQNKKSLEDYLFNLIIRRDTLEKEGLNVDEYNSEIEILKKQISELS